ncbi:hypothetical protein ALMP_57000 [Streptomyces sp. A012304]|nr:hypothetical protein ALMP_57000 [Streptomyces sp. A012304]
MQYGPAKAPVTSRTLTPSRKAGPAAVDSVVAVIAPFIEHQSVRYVDQWTAYRTCGKVRPGIPAASSGLGMLGGPRSTDSEAGPSAAFRRAGAGRRHRSARVITGLACRRSRQAPASRADGGVHVRPGRRARRPLMPSEGVVIDW